MRSTLYLKFIILYAITGFLSLFAVSALFPLLTTRYLESEMGGQLNQEATLLASNYLPGYFSGSVSEAEVYTQLAGMRTYLDSSIWFVDREGNMLVSVRTEDADYAPTAIEDFDPAAGGSRPYQIGDYYGYFSEDVITVMAPVTQRFATNGYLLIHKSYQDLINQRNVLRRNTYTIAFVVYLFSFLIFLGIHFLIYQPLKKVTNAATQYASGNLDVVIPVDTQDEMGYLSASLNYMSSQLRDMEDYQKTFVANVSHDFRSPLTSIKGYVEAMADGTIPPELQGRYLQIILFETERLTDLTQDLLTLNEFDTKNLLLDKSAFDIHEMIRNTAASFEGTCTEKKISISLVFASRSMTVYADRRKIQQVLYNLLDNAIKFSEPDTTITIETTERGEKVFISVKDEGIGIPKDSLNKIWDRFYKTDLSRGKDKKGTGLGLSIVKEAIQAHGENINVISTEGVGTEFIFSLPKK